MAADNKPQNGNGGAAPGPIPMQVRIVGQYIKDLSFENPAIKTLATSPPENPQLEVEINVEPSTIGPNLYESAIVFRAEAKSTKGVIYVLELIYGGMFNIEGAPPEAIDGMLCVNGPMLLFPFLRRLVADITREGGFPPLLLDPVDFAAIYIKKRQDQAAAAGTA